jgi:TusA-related sulfurtransferase
MQADCTSDISGLCRPLPVIKTKAARARLTARRVLAIVATRSGAESGLSLGRGRRPGGGIGPPAGRRPP